MAYFFAQEPQVQQRCTAAYPRVGCSALLLLTLAASISVASEARALQTRDEAPLTCESAASKSEFKAASAPVVAALTRLHPPVEVYSHHAVLIAPTNPLLSGGGFAADAYSSLPRVLKYGNFSTAFTKFVVVAHGSQIDSDGITVGTQVCGDAQLVDKDAAKYFRSHALQRLGHYVPKMLECAEKHWCEDRDLPLGLASQLPFLAAILGEGSPLKSNVLPIVMHGQGVRIAARLGDALSLVVQPGGVWEAERVLFVFAGDLSQNLPAVQADLCDAKTAEVVSQSGVPQIAAYFDDLLHGKAREGCPGPAAAPRGYAPMLAAARVAENLELRDRRAVVQHDGPPGGKKPGWKSFSGPVLGFMYVIFWKDIRSPGEQMGATAGAPSFVSASAALRRSTRRSTVAAPPPAAPPLEAPQQPVPAPRATSRRLPPEGGHVLRQLRLRHAVAA